MKSSDPVLHTVHMDGAAGFNLPFPFEDKVISRTMESPGLVNLRCNGGHVWMNAEMFIAPHPYYTVTDESGRFKLENVPPGTYELVAWHEGWNVIRQANAFDVLTESRVQRPIFSDPKTWEKSLLWGRTDTRSSTSPSLASNSLLALRSAQAGRSSRAKACSHLAP